MQKIRRDDEIIVIAGKDKGKRGKVLKVLADNRLVVGGVNRSSVIPSLTQWRASGAVSSRKKRLCTLPTLPFSMVKPTRLTALASRLKTARKFVSSSRPRKRLMLEHC